MDSPEVLALPRACLEMPARPVTARRTPHGVSRCRGRVSTMSDVPPDAIPELEGDLAVLLSCIVLRRRRAAAQRAQIAPSIVKSRPWECGFTVEGRAPNRHRAARDVFMRDRMRELTDN